MPADFVLDDRQLPNQCLVERHQIQLSGATKFDAVGLILNLLRARLCMVHGRIATCTKV